MVDLPPPKQTPKPYGKSVQQGSHFGGYFGDGPLKLLHLRLPSLRARESRYYAGNLPFRLPVSLAPVWSCPIAS